MSKLLRKALSQESLETMSTLSYDYLQEQPEFSVVRSTLHFPVNEKFTSRATKSLYLPIERLVVAAADAEDKAQHVKAKPPPPASKKASSTTQNVPDYPVSQYKTVSRETSDTIFEDTKGKLNSRQNQKDQAEFNTKKMEERLSAMFRVQQDEMMKQLNRVQSQ